MKKIIVIAMSAIIGLANPFGVLASPGLADIPTDHWAFREISGVVDLGFMEPNTQGQFMPNSPIDKFETARILANILGFNDTPEQVVNASYMTHSHLLANLSRRFARWRDDSNREIAFLLEAGVLNTADLDNFILVSGGQEQLRALSRQEAAMFLIRVFGLNWQASSNTDIVPFADDSAIQSTMHGYVHFLRTNGVVSPDEDGNFLPNAPVSRAVLAIMIYRTMDISASYNLADQLDVRVGTVTALHPAIQGVQIQSGAGSAIYRVIAGASINVNGATATFDNIVAGMEISATIENSQIIALVASTGQGQGAGAGTGAATPPSPPQQQPTTPPSTPSTGAFSGFHTTLQGHVVQIDGDYILIEISFITPTSAIVTEQMALRAAENLTITKPNQPSFAFADIIAGDVVSVATSGGLAFSIEVTPRERTFFGNLVERINHINTITYVIEDEYGGLHRLLVTPTTIIEREGMGHVDWNQVRIGDRLEINASGTNLDSVFAFASPSVVEGVVNIIVLRQDLSEIVVTTIGGTATTTYFVTGSLDGLGTLQVGNRVRLQLDSLEIVSFVVLN